MPEGSIGAVVCRLEIAHQGVTHLIAATGRLRLGFSRRGDCSRLDHPQERVLDSIVDAQAAKGDAAWLAIVQETSPAGIARNVVLGARVADGQLAAAAPASKKAGEQRVAVFGRSVMPACGHVVAHHRADRFGPFPTDIAVMDARNQRQPFRPRLAAASRPGISRCVISRCDPALTIGVGPTVDRVLDHPVDRRIIGPAPDDLAVVALGWQIQFMFEEPQQSLTSAAEFGNLFEDENNGFLDAAIRILLEPVASLHVANWGTDNEFAAPGFLVSGR